MKKQPKTPATRVEAAAEWVPTSSLLPWDRNPRLNHENVDRVADSIKRFGFAAPIVARKADRVIIAGHTRWKAAQALELREVPVRFLDLDPAEARLLALADNRLNELSPWDVPELQKLLGEFSFDDALLAGWSQDDLGAMADKLLASGQSGGEVVEDEAPEPPKVALTQPGDVWELGRHRLICGDATRSETLASIMGAAKADLMVTDPPYGVSVTGGTHDPRDPNYRKGEERKTIANDDLVGDKLEAFLRASLAAAAQRLTAGGAWYVWYADTETRPFLNAADELGGYRHILVWVKPNFVFGRCDYHYRHEPCLYGWKPGAGHTWLGSRNQSSVFELARDGAVAELKHPTVKPVRLYSIPIENHLKADGALIDPFAGSGPAFSAAEQTGRTCYGSELSPEFCDVIVERWQNLTGGKATRRSA